MSTIRDVATQAQVSVTTVSHVINGTRFVEPETEARVRAAIELLNYRPNSLARSLRRRQTSTIGLLVPDNSNPFFADIARAIEDAGFALGYSVILCNSDLSEVKQATYIDALLSKQVDGLLLIASGNHADPVEHIVAAGVPLVEVDRELGGLAVDRVLVDHEQGGYLAGHYLARLGHRRIGCIMGPSEATPSAGRVAGFQQALAEAGLQLPAAAIVRGNGRYQDGERATRELLDRGLGLTAIFAFNDLMAIGAINTLLRSGRTVPGDVSVIGFDGILQGAAMVPSLTTVAQPVGELGQISVRLLLERIRDRNVPPSRIVLPTTLIERESCCAV